MRTRFLNFFHLATYFMALLYDGLWWITRKFCEKGLIYENLFGIILSSKPEAGRWPAASEGKGVITYHDAAPKGFVQQVL